jgi:2,3-bisphosphoglycerate-dependent phosphoglycerate mutase
MTILVVRHGETDGNAQRILQRADVPLNERGMRQAEQLARRLAGHGFVHILCSDLPRARMTAAPVASLTGIAIEESPLLQERNFGDLRGTPWADLAEDPFGPDFAPPNGEDWPMFHARVADAFAFIVDRRRSLSGTLVVVTHGSSSAPWSSAMPCCPRASSRRSASTIPASPCCTRMRRMG